VDTTTSHSAGTTHDTSLPASSVTDRVAASGTSPTSPATAMTTAPTAVPPAAITSGGSRSWARADSAK
jgi:hypothetical protein